MIGAVVFSGLLAASLPQNALWSPGVSIDEPRENVLGLESSELDRAVHAGTVHAQRYPVTETGLLIPHDSLYTFLRAADSSPFRRFVLDLAGPVFPFRNFDELYDWLGLARYPEESVRDAFPRPDGHAPRVGAAILHTPYGPGLSFGCASCHATEFFGQVVFGLPNKRSRANEFFERVKLVLPRVPAEAFRAGTRAADWEVEMFRRSQQHLRAVRSVRPLSLGLDTSLSHVGRSLAMRASDGWASFDQRLERQPARHELDRARADSKPMPWWTLKYKNRWLADGAIVSGNPVLTNILWNEIGRGTDLRRLEAWVAQNQETIRDLTATVFAAKPPRFLEVFPNARIDVARAQHGERLFRESCASCHGTYEKDWSSPTLATTRVRYARKTRVIDVGTEANRAKGLRQLAEQLNGLELSRRWGIRVEPQTGYVPPPLDGIFARYPYLHNASVPNLCALLEPAPRRPRHFVQGPAQRAETDFDFDCVGYPTGEKIPADWRKDRGAWVDTRVQGRRPLGHERMLYGADDEEIFSTEDKRALIEFLKTL